MKVWLQIILEWLNCLEILETSIKHLKELEDGKFYNKLLELSSWKKDKENLCAKDTVIKFLHDTYPEFKIDNGNPEDMEQMCIASLFLLYISQKPLFQQHMCTNLQYDTQLKIKTFLEMSIPYGININRDILKEIINGITDDVVKTPVTPKTRTLKDFLNSPAAWSVQKERIAIERNREIRKLKNELELERFEKAYLQEDLHTQQGKLQSLQKSLQEKIAELKALREEKVGPNTPQSCKKNQNIIGHEQYYRKEIDRLEDQVLQKQCEIDQLKTDNSTVLKELALVKKKNAHFKEKFENYETSLESLQIQAEIKDTELLNLRAINDELRAHLHEITKTSITEESFEIEEIVPLNTSSSMNSSETLSSVIDVQLQEAKKESESLKTQLNILNKKLESTSQEYKDTTELLREKTLMLQDNETKLNDTTNKFSKEIESLQGENAVLINENNNLNNICVSQKESISQLEKANSMLSSEVNTLKGEISNLQKSLHQLSEDKICSMLNQLKLKDDKIENLITEITCLKLDKDHLKHLQIEGESKMKIIIKELETKFLEKQRQLDQLNIEIKLKQDTVDLLQNKLDRLSKETIVSEMKMKEVITNLHDVRNNQDAVLETQEKALKEKSLHLVQIEKEFNEARIAFSKQLEDEKLICKNLQSANSELQIESYKQMKTIEELQEVLKKERMELNENREYRKVEDIKKFEIAQICMELEQSINDLKVTIMEAGQDNEKLDAYVIYDVQSAGNDDKTNNILKTIKTSINEMHASRKLITYLFNVNANLNETLQNQKVILDNYAVQCDDIKKLQNKVEELQHLKEKHVKLLKKLIMCKESLKDYMQSITKSNRDLDASLNELQQTWDRLFTKFSNSLMLDRFVCDELKHIQSKKIQIENTLSRYNVKHLQNIKPMYNILWRTLLWTEEKLENAYSCSNNEQIFDISPDVFSNEKTIIQEELNNNTMLQKDIIRSQNEIEDFYKLVTSFEIDFKFDQTKFQSDVEKELQSRISELVEEKENLISKLDCAHMKNAKLEDYGNELKNKMEELTATSLKDTEDTKKEIIQLKQENLRLQEESNELNKRPKKEDVDNQLREIHDKYKVKVDEIKQNMKTAYNEQIAKLNKEQDQCIQEKLESLHKKMEEQCRKQADELNKYKAHVSGLSAQIWNIGEKLLSEQQEKEKLQKELIELRTKYQNVPLQTTCPIERRTSIYERRDLLPGHTKEEVLHKVSVIHEKTTYERCSIKSMQSMGNAFNVEDEQGEVFDNTYLADMKEGYSTRNVDVDRLSILKQRNALCKPHLKSSYPAEMQFHPLPVTEEEIKTGSVSDDIFNDSLSQSLLPDQKPKKKDRTQTSYKKPGPPTPSKNGGRLSLQGNELRSPGSRILRERNKDRATVTPRTLKSLFLSRRQNENVVTPRGRQRSSIFRKRRSTNER